MKSRAEKILRPVALSLAVAALVAISVYIASYLISPVTGIQVRGSRMLQETEVWQAVPDRSSLLTLNKGILERRLESNPWVKGVVVSEDKESGIVTVQVEEQRAVINGKIGDRRVVLAADGTELPGAGGANLGMIEMDESQRKELFRVLDVFEESGVEPDSIDGVGPGGIEVTVEDRPVLLTGQVAVEQLCSLPGFMERHREAEVFDLRSPDRIVIGASNG